MPLERMLVVKKTFILEGLDCAHCASLIEKAVLKVDGVAAASISLDTSEFAIEGEDEKFDGIARRAEEIAKEIEPDAVWKVA
jgi:copper chaperone CopZ